MFLPLVLRNLIYSPRNTEYTQTVPFLVPQLRDSVILYVVFLLESTITHMYWFEYYFLKQASKNQSFYLQLRNVYPWV